MMNFFTSIYTPDTLNSAMMVSANIGGEFFDQFPASAFAEFQQALRHREIIHCVGDGIGSRRRRKNRIPFPPSATDVAGGPLFVRHAHVVKHLEINDGNFSHG